MGVRFLGGVVALCLVPVGLQALSGPAEAGVLNYYVTATGSDSASGSLQAPWRTIAKATSSAPAGATIVVGSGSYAPFAVTQPGQSVEAASGAQVVVRGTAGVRDVVLLDAPGATLQGVTVTGCIPDPAPAGSVEDNGSSDVRIDDGADGATVQDVTITSSRGTNDSGLPFGCFGILAHGANASRIADNDISGTGAGVYLMGGGRLTVISGNRIHDNDVLIRDTPGGNDDFGATGIAFSNVDALPAAVATGNTITGNSGPSSDYRTDGGGFEIYNSSHVQMLDNTIADNDDVLETGTSPDGDNPLGDCVGNTFAGNTVSGLAAGSRLDRSVGMILRCATAMVVTDNTFTDIDYWVYDITTGDQFSSNVNALAITGNTISQFQKVYDLELDPQLAQLVIDANRVHFTGPIFASYADGTTSPDLAGWQARTHDDLVTTSD